MLLLPCSSDPIEQRFDSVDREGEAMIASCCCLGLVGSLLRELGAEQLAGWACFFLLTEFRPAVAAAGCFASFPLAARGDIVASKRTWEPGQAGALSRLAETMISSY
jgi:hypothetical protein